MAESRASVRRFGIAEWFGSDYLSLTNTARLERARAALSAGTQPACPYLPSGQPCPKRGGVCSIRKYVATAGTPTYASLGDDAVVVTCPNRFLDARMIFRWIGAEILGTEDLVEIGEIGFLDRVSPQGSTGGDRAEEVGRIDSILVVPGSDPLRWCAVETQAVYFSGPGMTSEFHSIMSDAGAPTFPCKVRRPDFRSSGPKRLMPQLQTKVPTLARWGKKTAVVIDRAFFNALGPMSFEPALSNADIAWFVVTPRPNASPSLVRGDVYYSTLANAVLGLTAGRPVTQQVFEDRIRSRLASQRLRSPNQADG